MKLPLSLLLILSFVSPVFAAESVPTTSWAERVAFKGDFRLRTERRQDEGSNSQIRNRIRLRPGFDATVNPTVSVKFRLATASDSADNSTSSNQTFDDNASKKPIWLDQAYFEWKPIMDLNIMAGKFPVPYKKAGNTEMIWDSDLMLEGGATKWVHKLEGAEVALNLGAYWMNERANSSAEPGPDLFLTGSQAAMTLKSTPIDFAFALAYFTFAGFEDAPFQGRGARGNSASLRNAGHYRVDYLPIVASLELGVHSFTLPLQLFSEVAQNTALSTNNLGQTYGVRIGALSEPGTWSVSYEYRDIESDAFVGAFSDSNFGDSSRGGTDARYHLVEGQMQAAQGVALGLKIYAGDAGARTNPRNHDRAQLDFELDF